MLHFLLVPVALALNVPVVQTCLPYEPAKVTITGVVSVGHGYGPPGFGEDPKHDAKETYPVLTLSKPICVSGGDADGMDDPVSSIRAFQLVSSERHHFDPGLIGASVAVTGTLFHRVSGGHTDVMVMYTDVRKAP
jgi:hypothetical protein